MEPQVSQVSWRASYRCTRLLILYLSVVKNELLTRRKGYLIIDIVRTLRWKCWRPNVLPVTKAARSDARRKRRSSKRNFLTRFWQVALFLSLGSANVRAFDYLESSNQIFRHLDIFFNQSIRCPILSFLIFARKWKDLTYFFVVRVVIQEHNCCNDIEKRRSLKLTWLKPRVIWQFRRWFYTLNGKVRILFSSKIVKLQTREETKVAKFFPDYCWLKIEVSETCCTILSFLTLNVRVEWQKLERS